MYIASWSNKIIYGIPLNNTYESEDFTPLDWRLGNEKSDIWKKKKSMLNWYLSWLGYPNPTWNKLYDMSSLAKSRMVEDTKREGFDAIQSLTALSR